MNRRSPTIILAALAFVGTAPFLAGCGSSAPAGSSTPAAAQTAVTELKVGSTSLGNVVTDANGRTLYMFTKDTKGAMTSACTDSTCLATWPPAIAAATPPKGVGVTGTIATIDVSGRKQVTLDGWPLHYYAPDTAVGDVMGEGVAGAWFVLGPAGAPLKTATSAPAQGGYGY